MVGESSSSGRPLRVYLVHEPSEEFARILAGGLSPAVDLHFGSAPPDPPDYDWLVAGVPTEEQLAASPRLRGLIIPWAGLPGRTRALLRERPDIAVHNLHHNAAATAEMAIGLLLAVAKRIVPADRALRNGDWRPRYEPMPSALLAGRTALVLGCGAIGRRLGRACVALGMSVFGTRRTPPEVGGAEEDGVRIVGPERLDSLLPAADVLLVSLPLTDETRGRIGPTELGLLPDGAILVNVARGPIVDESALFEELRSGRISAGLDVWYRYPEGEEERDRTFPSDHPFHELQNVVLSPHRAGHTDETERERARGLVALLAAAARGEPIPNRVDPERGY